MLEKIIFPVGGGEKIDEIVSFFTSIVAKRRFAVHGLGIVDIEGIVGSLSGAPPGAIGMAEDATEKIASNEKGRLKEFVGSLGKHFDKKKITYTSKVGEGDPGEEILKRSVGSDLLVIHSDSVFSYSKDKESTSLFKDIISRSPIPVLYLAGDKPLGDTIGVASDFSSDVYHAIYSFLHLGIFTRSRAIFSHVSTEEGPEKRFAPYQSFFELHGFENVEEVILKGEKDSAVRRFVETENIGLLIIGKRGESKLKDYLFGTLTDGLIENPACSLFIHD
jgi:nucleotide-binding universal stress UspA family protein